MKQKRLFVSVKKNNEMLIDYYKLTYKGLFMIYSVSEISYLKQNYGVIKHEIIANVLGKSTDAIRMQAHRMGLSNSKPRVCGLKKHSLEERIFFINDMIEDYLIPLTDDNDIHKLIVEASNLLYKAEQKALAVHKSNY